MDFELKSFVAILLSHILFGWFIYLIIFLLVLYVVWAYIPDRYFHKFGLIYYPSKHWSCTFPIFILFALCSLIPFIGFHERTMHPELDSFDNEYSTLAKDDKVTYLDTPLHIVNEKLYSNLQN